MGKEYEFARDKLNPTGEKIKKPNIFPFSTKLTGSFLSDSIGRRQRKLF